MQLLRKTDTRTRARCSPQRSAAAANASAAEMAGRAIELRRCEEELRAAERHAEEVSGAEARISEDGYGYPRIDTEHPPLRVSRMRVGRGPASRALPGAPGPAHHCHRG